MDIMYIVYIEKMNCFRIIMNGYDEEGGVVYGPKERLKSIALDGEVVDSLETLRLELKDGKYCSFHSCVGNANIVDEEMKILLEKYVD